jgi:hypothetical protein
MNMNQETIRSILLRAEELDRESRTDPHSDPRYADLVSAAAEAGINKDSVIQALRERIAILASEPGVGDMVFALSLDGDYHLAKFLGESGEYSSVEFYGGGTANVLSSMVKPFQMIPGAEVNVNWNGKGWVSGKVVGIDRENNWLSVEFGGESQYVDYEEVRLLKATPISKWPIVPYLASKIFLVLGSGAVGALLMWLAQRFW